jgi:tRNA(Arg) A34 adenosine deaminase TadA
MCEYNRRSVIVAMVVSDCVLYSSSRPCAACERAAAEAKIARMIYGAQAIDAGPPR